MLKRRSFIKTAGLLAAATLIAPGYALNVKKRRRLVVLGAGIAGLTAAYRLQQLGFAVDVVERGNRIGGRIMTYRPDPANPFTVEMGGEWIGSSHRSILKLIDELGLQTETHTFDTHLLYKGQHSKPGAWDFSPQAKQAMRTVIEKYNTLKEHERVNFDKMDWWRYLKNNGYDTRDLDLQDMIDSSGYGESIRQVSALRAMKLYDAYSPANEMEFRVAGGNDALCNALADKIGRENIHLNQQITRVKQTPGGVTAFAHNGNMYNGDKLVCALPILAVRKIIWEPEFSESRMHAINSVQYGRVNRTAFLFKERFWQDDNFSLLTDQTAQYIYHATRGQSGPNGVLMVHATGDRASVFGNADEKKRSNLLHEALNPVFGEVRNKLIKQNNYDWSRDAVVMGAFAIYKPGQWLDTLPKLIKEQHNIHFAGEHVGEWAGFMEGAVQSGFNVADQIIS